MSSLLSAGKKLVLLVVFGFAGAVSWSCWGQSTYLPQEAEYWISRGMVGDQVRPKVAVNTAGGYIVWQDNATDGDGLGISARALSSSFSPVLQRTFRVNQQIAGDQENPDVALVPTGGAVLAWQGGRRGSQRVYARFLGQDGAFSTGEIAVSSDTTGDNADACVVGLADGTAVVIWSNWGQDGSMQGVYGQRVSSSGAKLGSEFRANEFAAYNQRSPAVAALGNGGFVVAWASEQQRFERSVDVYARLFNSAGEPVASEFRLNSGTNVCANPVVASDGSDGFVAAWSELDLEQVENGWDVFLRTFGLTGVAAGEPVRLNGRLAGKQYAPRIASIGRDHLVVWTSLGQDQSREGVFGRFIRGGELAGNEFLVNTTTMSQQMEPAVTGDGNDRFLVTWTGFTFGGLSFELFAQRYSVEETLSKPPAPFVFALDAYNLSVTWPEMSGYQVSKYLLYVNSAAQPVPVTGNHYVLEGLAPASTHTVRLAFELQDGRTSAASDAVTGTTWGRDNNFDGLPDDWQASWWGANSASWPAVAFDSDGDGASNLQEFLAGTNPTDPDSVLNVRIVSTSQGQSVEWNAIRGCFYQAQMSLDLRSWQDVGTPRFAADAVGSILVNDAGNAAYYRIIRMR